MGRLLFSTVMILPSYRGYVIRKVYCTRDDNQSGKKPLDHLRLLNRRACKCRNGWDDFNSLNTSLLAEIHFIYLITQFL